MYENAQMKPMASNTNLKKTNKMLIEYKVPASRSSACE